MCEVCVLKACTVCAMCTAYPTFLPVSTSRADCTIRSDPLGAGATFSCATGRVLRCLQGQQLDSLIAGGPRRTHPPRDEEPGIL